MRNVLDESCRENQNTQFDIQYPFSYYPAVYEIMSRIMAEPVSQHIRRHNMEHTSCMLDKQGYIHARLHTRAPAHTHTHTHTHTQICNIYLFSKTIIREHVSVLRYTVTVCLVDY